MILLLHSAQTGAELLINTQTPKRAKTMPKKIRSPSRTYAAICNNTNWDGHYIKTFTIPENMGDVDPGSYFLNRLDHIACLELILTIEDLQNQTPAPKDYFTPTT